MGQPPRKLEEVIADLVSSLGIKRRIEGYSIIRLWSEVVGDRIAENAQPKEVKNGTLFVSTVSPAWAQELTFLRSRLREQLNRRAGKNVVRDIRFLASGFTKKEKSSSEKKEEKEEGGELAPERSAEIETAIEALPEGHLKERMRSFLRKEARFKGKTVGCKDP
jgi:hypothetical protein